MRYGSKSQASREHRLQAEDSFKSSNEKQTYPLRSSGLWQGLANPIVIYAYSVIAVFNPSEVIYPFYVNLNFIRTNKNGDCVQARITWRSTLRYVMGRAAAGPRFV